MTGRSDCAAFQEHLVEAAYGELTSAAAELLAAHLAICERCREESDWLGASRQALRTALAAPSHDAPGTLMVLPRATRSSPRWLHVAAAAALLALVALALSRAEVAIGPSGTSVTFRLLGDRAASPTEAETASAAVLAALRDLRSRDAQARAGLTQVLAQEMNRHAVAVREAQDAALAQLVGDIDRRRAQDLGFVLNQMGSFEQRTGVEMARTQQLAQYAVLAQSGRVESVR